MLPGLALNAGAACTDLGPAGAAVPGADVAGAGRAREAAPDGDTAGAAFTALCLTGAAVTGAALLAAWLACAFRACAIRHPASNSQARARLPFHASTAFLKRRVASPGPRLGCHDITRPNA